MVRVLFIFVAIALLLLSSTCSAASLEVLVSGLKSNDGDVHMALYNDPEHFPYQEGVMMEEKVLVFDNQARLVFNNLTPGDYGVAVYHDKNGNHEFDQIVFGIPLEDYGFSNNATVFFGPPSFDEAKFSVTEPRTVIEIDLSN